MVHIGTIIEKYRQASGISRKELSENICSEKHIYLIERGERSPSANMLKHLGDRLGINLFDFYPYLNCIEPLVVREKIRDFYIYRTNLDFDSLKKISTESGELKDFKNKPWGFEIQLNNLYYMAFVEKKHEETIAQLESLIKETKSWEFSDMFDVNAYTLMATLCLITGDACGARSAALNAYEIFRKKYEVERYLQLSTTITVNLMGAYYINGEYDDVINVSREFLRIKQRLNSYDRIHFIYFFMSFAYYEKKMREEAHEFLKKAIYFLMMEYRPTDVSYVSMDLRFREMLDDLSAGSEITRDFRKKYNI